MSTSPNLRKMLREQVRRPGALSGVLSAALGGFGKKALTELIVEYYNRTDVGVFEKLALVLLSQVLREIPWSETQDPTDEQSKAIQQAAEELQKSQGKFRAAVAWLCSPKTSERAGSPKEFDKLFKSGELVWGRHPDIDQTSEDFVKYFENHGLKHFTIRPSLQDGRLILFPRCVHLVDVFCAFLLNECSDKKPSEMALKTCRQCKKLFSSQQRKVAEFCSGKCRENNFWTPKRRRDYRYVQRLDELAQKCSKGTHGFSIKDLRAKLAKTKVAVRLDRIKKDWKDWPKIIRMIQAIKA